MSHYKKSIILIQVLIIGTQLFAQVNNSNLNKSDTSIIFLNKQENIQSFSSQVCTISKDQLKAGYSLNLLNALQGKLNGIDIKSGTWGNSASSLFLMRGERNLYGINQPIFIVDGIPVNNLPISELGIDPGSVLNNWNLDDIESVTVLKGGQAAALYGNRAGNGAVIIHTKSADRKGVHVEFNSSLLLKRIASLPEFQNKYGQGFDGQYSYSDGIGGGIYDDMDMSWGPALNGQLITQFDGPSNGWVNGHAQTVRGGDTWARYQAANQGIDNFIEPTPWVAQPDNVKDYFQSAWTIANNLGISLAGNRGGVRVSYTNVRSEDVTPGTKFIRNTIGANVNYSFFKKLSAFGSFQYGNTTDKNILIPEGNTNNPMRYFAWMGRQVNTNSLINYWQAGRQNAQQFNYEGQYWQNPYLTACENSTKQEHKNLFGTLGLKFDIARGFSFNYIGGAEKTDAHTGKNTFLEWNSIGEVINECDTTEQSTFRHSLFADYNFNIGPKNYFNSFAGLSFEKFKDHNLYKLGKAQYGESTSESNSSELYTGISYIRSDAYSLHLMLSRDNYKYPGAVSSPVFYSLSSGIELNRILHLPQLISKFCVQTGFSSTGLNTLPYYQVTGSFLADKIHLSTLAEYTLDMDLGIFDSRALLHAGYYNSRTKNGLIQVSLSGGTGYSSKILSTASVRNAGYELNLELIPVQTSILVWKSSFSFFKNSNKVLALGNGVESMQLFTENVEMNTMTGSAMGSIYGSMFDRYKGQVIYKDGKPERSKSKEFLGNVNPDYMIFFANSIAYHKFVFSASIEYSKGGISYSKFYSEATYAGTLSNTADRKNGILGDGVRWDDVSGTFVKNDVTVSAQDYYTSIYRIDENSVMDATYLKMRELNIAYSFKLNQKVNMTCGIFGQNIFTLSKSKDYLNGNLYFNSGSTFRGINNFNLPETYVLGVKLQIHI